MKLNSNYRNCLNCGIKFKIRESQGTKIFCGTPCSNEARKAQENDITYLNADKELQALLYQKLENDLILFEKQKNLIIMKELL